MKETLEISRKLRRRLESFLSNYPSLEEQGGYLLESRGKVTEFLPVPNVSDDPKHKFRSPSRARKLADKFSGFRRKVVAFWHSHPEPCIMSAADLGYAQSEDLIFVTISPTSSYSKDFIWYACKGLKPVKVEFC